MLVRFDMAAVVVAVLGSRVLIASTPQVVVGSPCHPKIEFICDAMKKPEGGSREEAALRAIAMGLQSDDGEVRIRTLRFLGDRYREINPTSIAAALDRFDSLGETDDGRHLLDKAALYRAARTERLRLLEKAIREGKASFGRVSELSRASALNEAGYGGFVELAPLVEEWLPKLAEDERRLVRGKELLVWIELRRGAENEDDGDKRMSEGLLLMTSEQLASRAKEQKGFASAIIETAQAACRKREGVACANFMKLYTREWERKTKALELSSGRAAKSIGDDSGAGDWWAPLGEALR